MSLPEANKTNLEGFNSSTIPDGDRKSVTTPFYLLQEPLSTPLCKVAEPRLSVALREGGFIVLEQEGQPLLVVKFRGRIKGLCVNDFQDKNGMTFQTGNWYHPLPKTKESLTDMFQERIWTGMLPHGIFSFMRQVDTSWHVVKQSPAQFIDKTLEQVARRNIDGIRPRDPQRYLAGIEIDK